MTHASAPAVAMDAAAFAYPGKAPSAERLTFALADGEALALIGPNGAGKSTILKGILGLIPCVAGEARVLGAPPQRAARRVGYMPQTDHLDPEFPVTLRQAVMMGRYRNMGMRLFPSREDRAAVDRALERVHLAEHAGDHFGSLSGGQQQRGMLARALVSNPALLLLDEPFNGLDRVSRDALLTLLRELRGEGVAIVVSTHDFEIATDACSHALLINRCQIAVGPVADTLRPEMIERAFSHATADDEAHSHFSPGHGHFHDPGYRPAPRAAGTVNPEGEITVSP